MIMDISQSSSTNPIHHQHSTITSSNENNELRTENDHLHDALEKALNERNVLNEEVDKIKLSSRDREYELGKKIEAMVRENEEYKSELDDCKQRIENMVKEKRDNMKAIILVKECMERVCEYFDEFEIENNINNIGERKQESVLLSEASMEVKAVTMIANEVEQKLNMCKNMRKKKMRELENSVMSLKDENQDLMSLLNIALVEKEEAEKSLNRLKDANEQKGAGILKIAERGLQKVGFGFMMGSGGNEISSDNSSPTSEDGSECKEEVVSLVSTLEGIMKDLRLEINQLRMSLEESRSDCERLQRLVNNQAQRLSEKALYIKELEDQEKLLMQNIENLSTAIKKTGEEVSRWKEACELEVEASKAIVKERDNLVVIFKEELDKIKAALNISNGKLQLKQELAEAAMAAQAAAERSLWLADSRAAQLHEQIKELTRQIEAEEKRETRQQRQWARHICWPWRLLKLNTLPSEIVHL